MVAAALCDRLNTLYRRHGQGFVDMRRIIERYGLPYSDLTGEQIVYDVAEKFYQGNSISAADKLLGDFRKGFVGYGSLEAPATLVPKAGSGDKSGTVRRVTGEEEEEEGASVLSEEELEGLMLSLDEADLPPLALEEASGDKKGQGLGQGTLDVGKGNYEGW